MKGVPNKYKGDTFLSIYVGLFNKIIMQRYDIFISFFKTFDTERILTAFVP